MTKADEKGNLWLFEPESSRVASSVGLRTFEVAWPEAWIGPFASVDFESYYSKKYSLAEMSSWEYVTHPAFDAYIVAVLVVYAPGRARIHVGPPGLIAWAEFDQMTWVSANAGFDELVYRRLQALGIIKHHGRPLLWECALDMASCLQRRRALQNALSDFFGIQIEKEVRDRLKGGGHGVTEKDLLQYVFGDAWWCAVLWTRVSPHWLADERALSRQTRYIGWQGIYVEADELRADIARLESLLRELANLVPWRGGGRATASLKEVSAQCAKEGIPAPPSLDLEDPQTEKWMTSFGDSRPWLTVIRRWTKANQVRNFFQMLLDRRRPDGTVPFTLEYCKAPHTHRWQSGKKLRLQNLDRDAVEGIKIRNRIRPRPGEKFIIADSTQIEPRVLNWLAGDTEFLKHCAAGQSPYEAHARASMGYVKDVPMKKGDPTGYQLAKARVLALGYQAGPPKFVQMAWDMCRLRLHEKQETAMIKVLEKEIWFDQEQIGLARRGLGDEHLMRGMADGTASVFPPGESVVQDFRSRSKKIRNFWYRVEDEMRADVGKTHHVHLPGGMIIHYFDVRDGDHGLSAKVVENSPIPDHLKYFYGGKLTENRVQCLSRCVLGHILLRLEGHFGFPDLRKYGLHVNFHVHDEAVNRCPEREAKHLLEPVLECFSREIPWAPGLPLGAEAGIFDYYDK